MAVDFRGHPMFPQTGRLREHAREFGGDANRIFLWGHSARGPKVSLRLPNHSHRSEAYAARTADESLSGPILKFIEAPPR